MANRYRRSSSRSRQARHSGGSLSGVFMLVGIIIGILVTSAGYMFFTKQSHFSKPRQHNHSVVAKAEKTHKKEKIAAQRFEFYTLLPGMEVQLPDAPSSKNPIAKKNASPNMLAQSQPLPTAAQPKPNTVAQSHSPNPANSQYPSTASPEKPIVNTAVHTTHTKTPALHKHETNVSTTTTSTNATKVSTAQYLIQAGIFQDLEPADELKATLALQGFNTRIQKVQTPEGHAWFRVTLGPFPSESSALQQKKLLAAQKIQGVLILKRPNT